MSKVRRSVQGLGKMFVHLRSGAVCSSFIQPTAIKHTRAQTNHDLRKLIFFFAPFIKEEKHCTTTQQRLKHTEGGICVSGTQEKLEPRQERQGGPCRRTETERGETENSTEYRKVLCWFKITI